MTKFADGELNGGNVQDVLESINQGGPESSTDESLRAVWRWLVFELENLLPHHSWHPYIRMGITVVSVRILSCRWDMPFTKFPRMHMV